jgi:hypothetical protein
LSDAIDLTVGLRKQTRELARGTEDRFVMAVEADALVVDLSDATVKQWMEIFVASVAQKMAIDIEDVSVQAAPTTIARRERARESRKGAWYRKNYAGGRIGELPPIPGKTALFNDSGRMKRFVLRHRKTSRSTHECTLNWPANRFNPQIRPAAPQMLERLQEVAPAFRGEFRGRGTDVIQQALDLRRELVIHAKQERQMQALQKQASAGERQLLRLVEKFKSEGDV